MHSETEWRKEREGKSEEKNDKSLSAIWGKLVAIHLHSPFRSFSYPPWDICISFYEYVRDFYL